MKVLISTIEYEITEVSPLDPALIESNTTLIGKILYESCQILIRNDLPLSLKQKVLRHELAHAFLNAHALVDKDKFSEEELCEFMAIYSPQINGITEKYFNNRRWINERRTRT